MSFRNEHFHYRDMPKPDRRVVLGVLASTFPGADASDKMWRGFYETLAFVRRLDDDSCLTPETIIGAAVVTIHPEHQAHSVRYAAIKPDKRHKKSILRRRDGDHPHHGTELLHYVYETMAGVVKGTPHPYHLSIDPYSEQARRFYRRAFPDGEYDVNYDEETNIISIKYNTPAISEVTEPAS